MPGITYRNIFDATRRLFCIFSYIFERRVPQKKLRPEYMKRHLLFSMVCILMSAFCASTVFADYIGPNPDLRTYTEYTIEQVSIQGLYVQCIDDTASPARPLGQYCDISHSHTPEGMTPPAVTSATHSPGRQDPKSPKQSANTTPRSASMCRSRRTMPQRACQPSVPEQPGLTAGAAGTLRLPYPVRNRNLTTH